MTGKPRPVSLLQRCWGRWRGAPDGVWKAAFRRQEVGAAGFAVRGVVLGAGRRDGRAAAFPSILTEVREGAASEHDESGGDALARGAQSSDRRAWLSQANADWALFCGFRLSRAQNRRRSGRSHTRDGGSKDQGRGKGRMVSTGGVSRSSLFRRTYHRRASGCHRAHPGGDAGDLKRNSEQAKRCAETSQAPLKARDDIRGIGRASSSGPHPIRRFAPPSPAELGKVKARVRRWRR